MTSLEDLYDAYTRAASEPDLDERIRLLRECAVEDFEISSPFPYSVKGVSEVARQLGGVAAAMPDGKLSLGRISDIDAHNSFFRVNFENRNGAGERLSTGLHIAEVHDGKLTRIIVFVPSELPSFTSTT